MVRENIRQMPLISDKRIRDFVIRSITMKIEYFDIGSYSVYISHAKNNSLVVGCSDESFLDRILNQIFEINNTNLISNIILDNGVIVKYKMNSDKFNQLMNVAEMNAFPKKRINELLNNEMDFTFCNLEIVYGNSKIKRCA